MAVGVLILPNRQSPASLRETKCLLSSKLPTGAWDSSPPSDVARTPLVSERLARPALPVSFNHSRRLGFEAFIGPLQAGNSFGPISALFDRG